MPLRLESSYTFGADRLTVWSTLLSPDALAGCIPGCESFESLGDGRYKVAMSLRIGPVKGAYDASVAVAEENHPSSFKMLVEASGSAGTVKGEGTITLAESPDGTEVSIEGDAQVTGVVARVGQRLMGSASKMLIRPFFKCMEMRVEGEQDEQ